MDNEILLKNSERFVRMIGEVVGVCWNAKEVSKTVTIGGEQYRSASPAWEKQGEPYIDFVRIRVDEEGYFEDEDSPVDGGFDFWFARQIANELRAAADWLESNQKPKEIA